MNEIRIIHQHTKKLIFNLGKGYPNIPSTGDVIRLQEGGYQVINKDHYIQKGVIEIRVVLI